MKKIVVVVLLLIVSISAFCQNGYLPIDSLTNQITYSVKGRSYLSKNELYLKSKDWATTVFINYNDVVLMDDKDLAKIRLKGAANIDENFEYGLKYNILITCTDSAYNFTLSDVNRFYFGSRTFAAEEDYNFLQNHKKRVDRLNNTPKSEWTKSDKKDYPVMLKVIPKWERETDRINEALLKVVNNYQNFMQKK